jgi:hypothetical protein
MKKTVCIIIALSLMAVEPVFRAQVTIGGLTPARTGLLLDLNSDIKGSLLLSNAVITDIDKIPAGNPRIFPHIHAGVNDMHNHDFVGALVFNTNEQLAPNGSGIYVWNGEQWDCLCEAE